MIVRQVKVIDLTSSSGEGYTKESYNIHDLETYVAKTTFCSVLEKNKRCFIRKLLSKSMSPPSKAI